MAEIDGSRAAQSGCRDRRPEAYEEGIPSMLTIIKAALLASALMLLESCTGYLTSCELSGGCPFGPNRER